MRAQPTPATTTPSSPEVMAEAGSQRRVPLYVWLISLAVAGQAFAGSWGLYGVPVPLDRPVLLAGLVAFALHPDVRSYRFRLLPLHLVMAAGIAWVVASMIWFDTLTDTVAIFALLDAFGIVPFLLFVIAPIVYGTSARRDVLAGLLTGLGLYIGWVSVAQGLSLYGLVFPQSILQPDHGHFDRALGPSLQVASNGLALLACGTFAGVYAARHRGWRRWVASLSFLLCLAGVFFTLTRSMWLAALVAIGIVVLTERRLRLPALGLGVVGLLAGGLILSAVPGVAQNALQRAETSRSVFDRLNANEAAVRVVTERPLTGVGFQRFHQVAEDWVRLAPTYPITNTHIDVHNVPLGYAAELGLPGVLLWVVPLLYALWSALRGRRDPGASDYRLAAVAFAVAWFIVAMLVPLKYALPMSVLWLLLGMVSDPRSVGWTDASTSAPELVDGAAPGGPSPQRGTPV
ncbi:MAG: O-antigen ligase family protein [Mobilicoccus sp.]|nr:O-antigen ligase family protein [Mobilicoccus sp.]